MKKIYLLYFLIYLFLNHGFAQNVSTIQTEKGVSDMGSIDYDRFYIDAAVGYFPQSGNASWATQLSVGTRLNEASSLGIGATYWGRIQTYKRSALGIGLQYRRRFWENFIGKIEGGYLLNHTIYDGVLNKNMVFISESSRPFYYKIDLNVRFMNYFTFGVSACQSGSLFFRRYAGLGSETVDQWRINAFTIQLGIALEKANE
jgi:hypothetical protein